MRQRDLRGITRNAADDAPVRGSAFVAHFDRRPDCKAQHVFQVMKLGAAYLHPVADDFL